MSVRRALVDCAVLSLQDSCVLYPCCTGCFSRIDVQPRDATRCRCSRCGYSCLRAQVDYRYRLSLLVTRDGSIFGVTVFGTCLNPFFGIHASGLHRLLENLDGPAEASTRSTLLVKAVGDCFIGRHFIFGIKVSDSDSRPWLGGPDPSGSDRKDAAQFIASQMILPKAAGLGGCSVVRYYQVLLQKAVEFELGSSDASETSGHPAAALLLIPHHSPASSFHNAKLSVSDLLSHSLQRSPHQDRPPSPTPPWEQSLGLVTSSAEQEEDCSTQDGADENSKQMGHQRTPHRAQRRQLQSHNAKEMGVLSSRPSFESGCHNSPSFVKYPYRDIPSQNTCFNVSQPSHINDATPSPKARTFSSRRLTKTFMSSSLIWEDLPFSESLSEFLFEEDFERAGETHSRQNVQNHDETVANNIGIGSQDQSSSAESFSVYHGDTRSTERHSQELVDITNTTALCIGDRSDLSAPACKDPAGCRNYSQARNMSSSECNQEGENAISLLFESTEGEKLEGSIFNYSADLFSSFVTANADTDVPNMHAETNRTSTDSPDKQLLRCEKTTAPLTSDKLDLKDNQCISRGSCDCLAPQGKLCQNRGETAAVDLIQCNYSQSLDFIPSSQSTPVVKVVLSSHRTMRMDEFSSQPDWQSSCVPNRNPPGWECKKTARMTSYLSRFNRLSADQLPQCSGESTNENTVCSKTPSRRRTSSKRRFWRADKQKRNLLAREHLKIERGALNMEPAGETNYGCDLSFCDLEDNEVIFPPTPAPQTPLNVALRRGKTETDTSSCDVGRTRGSQQADVVNNQRTVLDRGQTGYYHLSLLSDCEATGCDTTTTADEGKLDGCHDCDESEGRDWSRDLFSDSR